LAAAVDPMSRSANRQRLDCPAARAAANIRPYMQAASASKGSACQVAAAHGSRSWRRAFLLVACGVGTGRKRRKGHGRYGGFVREQS
jgi:hypothetical protein